MVLKCDRQINVKYFNISSKNSVICSNTIQIHPASQLFAWLQALTSNPFIYMFEKFFLLS